MFQGEDAIQFLGQLVSLVDRLINISVIELAGFPTLEFIVKWVEHLMPTMIIICINQSLFP